MQIQVETLKSSEVKLIIELSADEMANYKKQAVESLQDKVKVDGFRAGKIPAEMLEQKIGKAAFMGQVIDMAVGATYEQAIREKEITPVDYPKISMVSEEPFKYEATVVTLPEVEWKKDLDKLKVKKKEQKVEDKEVDEVLQNLQSRSTNWSDVDRAAKMEDRVEIDFDGFDEKGEALEGTSSKNHPVILGSNSLIPGFEEEVVGMKKDEEKEFDITFPEDYHSDKFKSKKVKFKIKLNRIEEASKPELNDEFANEITGGHRPTLKDLKEEIVEELHKQKLKQEELQLESDFIKEIPAYVKAELPEILIEREMDFMIDRMKQDLARQGKTWEDYEKEMKDQKKDVRKELEPTAKEQVLVRLGLEAAYKKEDITVGDEEVDAEIKQMIAMYPPHFAPMAEERLNTPQEKAKVFNQLRLRKLVANHTA